MRNITILLVLLFVFGLAYSQDIPMDGLVGYWKLDEGEGGIAGDSSGCNIDHGDCVAGVRVCTNCVRTEFWLVQSVA